MEGHERESVTVDKRQEMRSSEIANMINEGGLGADNYYNILKHADEKRDEYAH